MKTEDVIINYNRQRPCEYANMDVRFDNISHYIENANKQSQHKVYKKNTHHYRMKFNVMFQKSCSFQFHAKK